jgi:hypothetical protein
VDIHFYKKNIPHLFRHFRAPTCGSLRDRQHQFHDFLSTVPVDWKSQCPLLSRIVSIERFSKHSPSKGCLSQRDRTMTILSTPPVRECGSTPSQSTIVEELSSFAFHWVKISLIRRVLPYPTQRSVGPFIFLDLFGPVCTNEHTMNVESHPHIGLVTITFYTILHRDSTCA